MKKKILQIITLPVCGGAQNHLLEIITSFQHSFQQKEAYEFHVLAGEEGYLTNKLKEISENSAVLPPNPLERGNSGRNSSNLQEPKDVLKSNFTIIQSLVWSINPFKDIQAFFEISNFIKKYQPDLVHCHSSKAGIIGRLAAWANGIPSIFTAHGWSFHPKVKPLQRTIALVSETICSWLTSKIICVSSYDLSLAQSTKLFNHKALTLIHNGISRDIPTKTTTQELNSLESLGSCKDKLKILMVSRFEIPKRQNLLIQAFAELKSEAQDKAHLVFVGDGKQKAKSEELVKDLDLKTKITFLGELSSADAILQQADIFALVSDREGLPISIIEAMKYSLPIIASDVGGISDLVQNQENGFLINSKEELTEKLKILIEQSSLREKMSQKSKTLFEGTFSSKTMIDKLDSIYQS